MNREPYILFNIFKTRPNSCLDLNLMKYMKHSCKQELYPKILKIA